ncbi:MAG: carboxymuconolactone decarboxylase family protein [Acidimicrobiia bacterium]
MGREDVHREMKETLGTVLFSFDWIPDELVDSEWDLVKRLQFGETLIPHKYKELIGLAVAAVSRCRYGTLLHAEAARLHGATEAELAEAVHYAKLVSGWSIELNGLQVDQEEFAHQVDGVVAFLRKNGTG